MLNVGQRIKQRRKELGFSADYVAKQLGKNRATIYRYESDEIENMAVDVVKDLAKVLKTSPAYLMGWSDSTENLSASNEYMYFDTAVSAGLPNNIEALTEKEVDKITIPDIIMGKWAGDRSIFITRINGDSMNNVMEDGSLIAVKPVNTSQLKDGDIVVYQYDNEYAVKRFYRRNGEILFKPDSKDPTFTDLVIDYVNNDVEVSIKGKVVLYLVELD